MKPPELTRYYWRPVAEEPEIDMRDHRKIALGEGHAARFSGWALQAAELEGGDSVAETARGFVLFPDGELLAEFDGPWAVFEVQVPGPCAEDGSFAVLSRWYGIGSGGLLIGYPSNEGFPCLLEAKAQTEEAFRRAFERAWAAKVLRIEDVSSL